MEPWEQVANPLGNLFVSALVAAIPIIYLGWALAIRKMKGHVAAFSTVALATLVAVVFYRMPLGLAVDSVLLGALKGLAPIGYVVLAGVFLYNLTVASGQFEVIKASITKLSDDQRIQAILIGFCFSAFIEGCAGFGTPVAIAAAMMIGLGFPPLYAAGLALVANSVPVAYGSIGIPITTAANVTSLSPDLIGAMVGRQLPILTLIVPAWIVMIMGGWKAARGVLPACTVAGVSFAAAQFVTSNFLNYQQTDLVASMVSIVALVGLLVVWKPAVRWSFGNAPRPPRGKDYSGGEILRAWLPYIITSIVILVWGRPEFKTLFGGGFWAVRFAMPGLDNGIIVNGKPLTALYDYNWLTMSGTAVMISTALSALALRMPARDYWRTLQVTFGQLKWSLAAIACFLAYAELSGRSGMGRTLGEALASTGVLFAFFAPVIGYIGVFLTGSDTSSNALFGKLQQVAAQQTGISDILAVASNSTGGCAAKMISPQSIAVGAGATGMVGQEGNILRFTLKHSLLFVLLIGAISWLQAHIFGWMIPHP